jgi:hypothetical protein
MTTTSSVVNCAAGYDANGKPLRCPVDVRARINGSGRCVVDDQPNIQIVGRNFPVVIVWNLVGPFRFCPAMGDGVFLKDLDDVEVDDQFEDMFSGPNAGDPDDKPSDRKCHRKFRWHAFNTLTPSSADKNYPYEMRFRHNNKGFSCTVDPWVRNGTP